jgi:hypothetical protein
MARGSVRSRLLARFTYEFDAGLFPIRTEAMVRPHIGDALRVFDDHIVVQAAKSTPDLFERQIALLEVVYVVRSSYAKRTATHKMHRRSRPSIRATSRT